MYEETLNKQKRQSSAHDLPAAVKDYAPNIEAELKSTSTLQLQLVESRERLLVKREKVRASAQKVQLSRMQTGNAEISFMDKLRDFINEINRQLPVALRDAYAELVTARNEFAVAEDNYLQSERELSGIEWQYIDQENDFYQIDLRSLINTLHSMWKSAEACDAHASQNHAPSSLPSPRSPHATFRNQTGLLSVPSLPPPAPPSLPPRISRSPSRPSSLCRTSFDFNDGYMHEGLDDLREAFDVLRDEQSERMECREIPEAPLREDDGVDVEDSDFKYRYFDILERLSAQDVKEQQLKHNNIRHTLSTSLIPRRNSAPESVTVLGHEFLDTLSVAHTESALVTLNANPTTWQRIYDWRLEYPRPNIVEKKLCCDFLQDFGVSEPHDDAWKSFVIQDCQLGKLDGTSDDGSLPSVTSEERHRELDLLSLNDFDSLDHLVGEPEIGRSWPINSNVDIQTQDGKVLDGSRSGSYSQVPACKQEEDTTRLVLERIHALSDNSTTTVLETDNPSLTSQPHDHSNRTTQAGLNAELIVTSRSNSGCDVHSMNCQGQPCPHSMAVSAESIALLVPTSNSMSGTTSSAPLQQDAPDVDIMKVKSSLHQPCTKSRPDDQKDLYDHETILSRDDILWNNKNWSSFQNIHVHVTPPSPPPSRPASERERKSTGDRLRCFFAKKKHKRSLSTSAAFIACNDNHSMG